MPNGYTAGIYEGRDVTLADYLMGVGRSMGFAVMQRDEPMDAPVRPVEPYTSYHDERLAKARATLAEVDALTVADATLRAKDEYDAAAVERTAAKARREAMRARYATMVQEVEAWQPEPLIAPVKEAALKYLRESMEFDCGDQKDDARWYPYPRRLSGDEWINERRTSAQRDIEYHEAERRKEVERTAERNRWITAFLDSLPQ